ncbi:transcription termination/antitermination NusG family protein [Haliea sp. E1-2-M8]|uniref:transcription termination/antitermination NusG family protein n=1 Tax=Haliea sp. E1-2-M8 TaxID=3064706 RepID=UPI00271949C0|nr:transcription termination/antitermination NusG family protein [Haliea sp. E1-2-M8]MDO8862372.1 transcription termination/antitermination NusG family protein [Haliea sp. E1-2-M8]
MTWLVVHSKPREEDKAARNLCDQGFETFAPRIRERKRGASGWRVVTGPLFPRYIFINVALGEQSTASIRNTPGVCSLVRFGQQLAPVPDTVVGYLQTQQNPELGARSAEAWPQQPGDRVQILEGPFAGLNAVFEAARGDERAALLLDLLGRQNRIVVRRDALSEAV